MRAHTVVDEAKLQDDLFHLISTEGLRVKKIISALEKLEKKHGPVVYRVFLYLTAHLDFSSRTAQRHWDNICHRYHEISDQLHRPIDFRVAVLDYFTYEKKIKHPIIVEIKIFQKTVESSVIDELTKLYNYRYFLTTLYKEFKRAERFNTDFSLLMFDIDNFKAYNDRNGHLAGNDALRKIAKAIVRTVRGIDTVCRYGGEEFVIILPRTDCTGAFVIAERVRTSIARLRFINARDKTRTQKLTVSGGIAWYCGKRKSHVKLIKEADSALYIAKSVGKNNNKVFGHR